MQLTSGVAQGSTPGPDLWNATYDSLLKLDMQGELRLVGYADDVVALVVGRTVEQAQGRLSILMRLVSGHGFNLALEKVIILANKRIPTQRPIAFVESIIKSKPPVNNLGLTLDSKMSFFEQISEQGCSWSFGLSILMANIGGPTSNRRRLLMSSTQFALLYAVEA